MEYTAKTLLAIELAANANAMGKFTPVVGTGAYALMKDIKGLTEVTVESLNTIPMGEETFEHFYELVEAREVKKLTARSEAFSRKTKNRATYLPTATMAIAATRNEGRPYWRYELDLESDGLMASIVNYYRDDVTEPVGLQLVNRLPFEADEQGEDTLVRHGVDPEEYEFFAELGYAVSKEKVAWKWEYVSDWFVAAFPKAIDFCAYNHRMRSPLLPGGYFPEVLVAFHSQECYAADPMSEALATVLGEVPGHDSMLQQVDGSGLYDPEHPMVQEFVSQHGAVVMQISLLNEDGLFAKGILVPRPGISAKLGVDTAFCFDHLQVKGSHKDAHKKHYKNHDVVTYDKCHVGIMKTWGRRAKMGAGFEQLENIGPIQRPDESKMDFLLRKRRVLNLITELTDEGMEKLLRGGIDRLLGKVAKNDRSLKLIIDFCAKANAQGAGISPLTTTMVKNAVDDALQKALWVPAQGAGIVGEQLVVVQDASLAEGEVVVANHKPGTDCALWRFPTVLACGLVVGKVVRPRKHHMVAGKIIPYAIFMNPQDVLKMQGDDDGDIVGMSTDPRVVELWQNRLDDRFYAIEPEGVKFPFDTDSPEGWEYTRFDPRGPVGECTIARSKLLAVGDLDGALAMSVCIQEAIDAAKRQPRYTNWTMAAIAENWKLCTDGKYHIHWKKVGDKYYPHTAKVDGEESNHFHGVGEFPLDEIMEWAQNRLHERGCLQFGDNRQNPLGWYIQHKVVERGGKVFKSRVKKRVPPSTWEPCAAKQGGWTGGNHVHTVHDRCLRIWREHESEFLSDFNNAKNRVGIHELLPKLLEGVGSPVQIPVLEWDEYLALRERSGLTAFGKEMGYAISKIADYDQRMRHINMAQSGLEAAIAVMNPTELATIWYYETRPMYSWRVGRQAPTYTNDRASIPKDAQVYFANNHNHAFRAVSCTTSKILPLLDIEVAEECKFLEQPAKTAPTRLGGLIKAVNRREDPFAALSNVVFGDTWNDLHAEAHKDENGQGIPLHRCESCRRQLQDNFVRSIRAASASEQELGLKKLIGDLRSFERSWNVGDGIESSEVEGDTWDQSLYV